MTGKKSITLEMPDFTGFAMRTFLRGSNPSLPTNKGLQETADPFVLLINTCVTISMFGHVGRARY